MRKLADELRCERYQNDRNKKRKVDPLKDAVSALDAPKDHVMTVPVECGYGEAREKPKKLRADVRAGEDGKHSGVGVSGSASIHLQCEHE